MPSQLPMRIYGFHDSTRVPKLLEAGGRSAAVNQFSKLRSTPRTSVPAIYESATHFFLLGKNILSRPSKFKRGAGKPEITPAGLPIPMLCKSSLHIILPVRRFVRLLCLTPPRSTPLKV